MIRKRRLLALLSTGAMVGALTGLTATAAHAQSAGYFGVNTTADTVYGMSGFSADVTVTIGARTWAYDDGSGRIEYDPGSEGFALYLQRDFDVQPGQDVTVSSTMSGTKTLHVAAVAITAWDFTANTVSGTTSQSAPGDTTPIYLSAGHYGQNDAHTLVVQRSGTTWTSPSFTTSAEGPFQLRINDAVEACTPDAAGDNANESCATQTLAGPRFAFGTELQEVVGLGWPAGTPVTLRVSHPPSTKTLFTATVTPPSAEPYSMWLQTGFNGTVYFDLTKTGFQARAGDVMSMTNGTFTKVQTIPDLTVALPDIATGEVSGTTNGVPVGGFLSVAPGWFAFGGTPPSDVTPLSGGSWTVSFGPGSLGSFGPPVAYQTDADGDMTESHGPQPSVYVDPATDRVWAPDFGPGNVTLRIQRSGSTVYTKTVSTTNVLTRGSWNLDMWATPTGSMSRPAVALYDLNGAFDVQGGDVVTVADTVSSLTMPVARLTVDKVNDPVNHVSGTGTDDETIGLHLGDGEGGFWGYSATPAGGSWDMFFNPAEFPNQGLEAGMHGQAIVTAPDGSGATVIRWTVPSATPTRATDLIPAVEALHLPRGTERDLVRLLTDGQKCYDAGRNTDGNRKMADFIHKVQQLSRKTITAAAAQQLIDGANAVIAAHGG